MRSRTTPECTWPWPEDQFAEIFVGGEQERAALVALRQHLRVGQTGAELGNVEDRVAAGAERVDDRFVDVLVRQDDQSVAFSAG